MKQNDSQKEEKCSIACNNAVPILNQENTEASVHKKAS